MSYTSMIDVKFAGNTGSAMDVLQTLMDHGWTVNDHGSITYLPIGDSEMFDWQQVTLNAWPDVREILRRKSATGEPIGIVLTWQNTDIGGDFHIDPAKSGITAGWSVNRKTVEGGFTDQTWYILRVLTPLVTAGIQIESFRCIESI